MEKWKEVTGKGARRSLRLTPEKSSLRESVVCVEEQPDSVELLCNPEGFEIYYAYSTTLASDAGEPRTYKEALKHQDVANLKFAIRGEIDNFYKRDVWKKFSRTLSNGRKPLGTRWVFKRETEQDKSFRYKGRFVVK